MPVDPGEAHLDLLFTKVSVLVCKAERVKAYANSGGPDQPAHPHLIVTLNPCLAE